MDSGKFNYSEEVIKGGMLLGAYQDKGCGVYHCQFLLTKKQKNH